VGTGLGEKFWIIKDKKMLKMLNWGCLSCEIIILMNFGFNIGPHFSSPE
jgi:hypothetical protein